MACFVSAQQIPETRPPDIPVQAEKSDLEAFVDGILTVQLKENHIAGAVFCAVEDGKIILSKGYGFADVGKKISVSPEKTLFRVGSISKLFTWTAVMQLVEQGKIDLNADINTYLSLFKVPPTYPEPITMTQLMSHTAGLEELGTSFAVRNPEDLESLEKFLAENMPARIFPPGKLAAYSNYGSALAGYIVEIVSGIPFEEYIEKNIFKPLGMVHASFRQPLPSTLAEDMSTGYKYNNGTFVPKDFELLNGLAPAGSLSASANAMAKFVIAHLQDGAFEGNRILEEKTARLMHSRLFSHDPRLNGNAHGFWELTRNNIHALSHGGDTMYFHSKLVLIPEKGFGFFISYNSIGGSGAPTSQLTEALIDRYYPADERPDISPPEDFQKRAEKYTGVYGLTRVNETALTKIMKLIMTFKVRATENNTLAVTIMGGETTQYVEIGPHYFRERDGQGILLFKENKEEKIIHAFLSKAPMAAGIRLSGTQTPMFNLAWFIVTLLFLVSIIVWPVGAIRRKICKPNTEKPKAPASARWLAGSASILCGIFLIGMLSYVINYEKLFFGIPLGMKVLLVLPLAAAIMTIGVLICTLRAWWRGYWTRCGRWHYTFVFLALLSFFLFLNTWNLLGFKF